MAAELAQQLLRAMADEESADESSEDEEGDGHERTPGGVRNEVGKVTRVELPSCNGAEFKERLQTSICGLCAS